MCSECEFTRDLPLLYIILHFKTKLHQKVNNPSAAADLRRLARSAHRGRLFSCSRPTEVEGSTPSLLRWVHLKGEAEDTTAWSLQLMETSKAGANVMLPVEDTNHCDIKTNQITCSLRFHFAFYSGGTFFWTLVSKRLALHARLLLVSEKVGVHVVNVLCSETNREGKDLHREHNLFPSVAFA